MKDMLVIDDFTVICGISIRLLYQFNGAGIFVNMVFTK